ncbi:hypothetical protein B0H14DRAFT_2834431 [Mycena olivaceomarginata]|nr:hypothetical protein B0H14DRAFT_2834431 [Mycena olivaceomarginata]
MRALSALPLDDDIVDRIMTFSPTFSTLQALMLVSKAFYSVYQTHPKSITRAVAYNIVGPALPQALRVIRYQYAMPDGNARDKEDPDKLATECPEEHSPSVITADEKQKLQENSKVVYALEDIYSLTQKDRTSRRSVLTSEESWRFRRAVYRIMFYTRLFSGDRYDLDEIADLGEDGVKHIRLQRMAVLKEYPTDELRQIYAVVQFMRDILAEVADGGDPQIDVLLSDGPNGVRYAWEERSTESIEEDLGFTLYEYDDEENELYTGYFSLPLNKIWMARGVKPPKDDDEKEPPTKWILDAISGGNDTCSQCATPGGLKLLTEANWHRMEVPPAAFLKNRLKDNTTVTTPFQAALASFRQQHYDPDKADDRRDDEEWLGTWIGGVFDVPRISGGQWDGWKRDGSYCQPCLRKFLDEHVWRWFLWERVKGGWAPPEDCWYGYNCKTMVHKRPHAEGKNHLCVPTKGDP